MKDYSLQIVSGPKTGMSFLIAAKSIIIGRNVKDGISISDVKSSKHHVKITKINHEILIEDLKSTNGTFINGNKILKPTALSLGDCILIGATELKLVSSKCDNLKYSIDSNTLVLSSSLGILVNHGTKKIDFTKHYKIDPQFNNYQPQYLNLCSHIENLNQSLKFGQMIFEYSGDFLVKDQLSDAFSTLIKLVGKKIKGIQCGAALTVNTADHKLSMESIYNFSNHTTLPCFFHLKGLEDVIYSKKATFISSQNHNHPMDFDRLLIPIIGSDQVIIILHLECDKKYKIFNQINQLSFCQALISRITPNLENLLLRKSIDSWQLSSIMALITAIEAKDTYTAGHSERVCRYSMAIGDQLNLDRNTKRLLMISSLCHDVGKLGTPDHILKNSSLLNHEEYVEIKHHPSIGDKIIKHLPFYEEIKGGIRHHHEKRDGTGYPDGLAGDEIPLFGRIVAIADAFDAMISGRSYSGFLDAQLAMEKLSLETDVYDPHIIKAFCKAYDSGNLTQKTGTKEYNMDDYYASMPTLDKKTG